MTDPRNVSDLLLGDALRHGTLVAADEDAIRSVPSLTRVLQAGEDIVCQGERPDVAVLAISGMLARYHTLPNGDRQYLSFHISGDMPDLQSLFLAVIDYSVCALDQAEIALFPHDQLRDVFGRRPALCFAFWRLTLVDAAIFRQAITNNTARRHESRLAHFFCEHYLRAREMKLVDGPTCALPLNQTQLGQALGMSIVSANRTVQKLRKAGLIEFRAGRLTVLNWSALTELAGFDPTYLHL